MIVCNGAMSVWGVTFAIDRLTRRAKHWQNGIIEI